MGRKKKNKQVDITAKESSTLKYSGTVNISILKKGKVIKQFKNHNEGTNNLFLFILNCLAGEYYEVDRPKWIVPYKKVLQEEQYSIGTFIPINDVKILKETNTDTNILSYKCLITSLYLDGDGTQIDGLLFYSDNEKNSIGNVTENGAVDSSKYSMKMEFGDIKENKFKDQDILIEWQVRIISATQTE